MPGRKVLVAVLVAAAALGYALLRSGWNGGAGEDRAAGGPGGGKAGAGRPAEGAALRVLSLSPNVTEILFRLGLDEEIAGVTDFCRFPAAAAGKPKVGALLNQDLERMFALEPTLVIALPAHGTLPEQMAARGIRTLVVRNDTVEDVFESIESIGEATGRAREAVALVDSLRGAIAAVRGDPPARRWRTMIVVSRTPGTVRDVFVAGRGTYLGELLATAGGTNVFEDALAKYPEPGAEEVLHRNPELIIEVVPLGKDARAETGLARAAWGTLPGLDAAARGNVYSIAGDHLLVPGPRLGEALADIARVLREAR